MSHRWTAPVLAAALCAAGAVYSLAAQEPAPAQPERPSPAEDASAEPQAPTAVDGSGEDSDSDSDSDSPVRLKFVTDASCNVYVDGKLEGRATPEQPLEVGVDLGEVELRANSAEVPQAAWEKTLELEEAGEETVRIKMKRTIRQFRKEERKSGVYRDQRNSLMWPKRDNGRDVDLRGAYAYCRDLGTAGFDDWRLPTLAQLESLQAIWARTTYKIQGDIALSECCVWSSDYDGTSRAWTYNYRFRESFQTNAGYEIGLRALCVRDWDQTAEPAEAEDGADTGADD